MTIQKIKCPKCGKEGIIPNEFNLWECKECRYFSYKDLVLKYNELDKRNIIC